MSKVCPLYKQAWIAGLTDDDETLWQAYSYLRCDRNNCALWIPSKINPEEYGHCGLRM